jgi:iron complex outermembrane recepter protein
MYTFVWRHGVPWLAASHILLTSVSAFGQGDPQASPAEATVTVRGTRAPQSASETTLDAEALRSAPRKTGSDILAAVPGVFVSQHGGEGKAHQIFFRGFDAVHGQDVELTAGGAPVNDVSNIHGQGYADLHFLIPEVVAEVRSTPGTYDPRQGDFAVAGSIDFAFGYDEPGVTAKAAAGSFDTRRYFLAYHPRDTPRENFAAFELYTTDGFGPSRAARRTSGIGQVLFDLGSGLSARALASTYFGRFDSAGVLRLDDVESGRVDRFATYDPEQGGHSSRSSVVLELARARVDDEDRPERFSLAPFVVFRSLGLRSNFTGNLTSPEGDSIQQLNDATTLGARASYRRGITLFSAHDSFEAGVYVRADTIEQSQHRLSSRDDHVTDDAETPGIEAAVRGTNAAGYIDAELHPLRRVTLRGGLRVDGLGYEAHDTGDPESGASRSSLGAQLSPRGTVSYAPVTGLRLFASYGDGFRSPQIRSLGNGETTPFTRVTSAEIGARYADQRRVQASLAAFRTRLSDDLVFDHATGRNEYVPGTTRLGIAGVLAARPNDWFNSLTSFTFTRAAFTEDGFGHAQGELLPYVPQVVLRSELSAHSTLGKVLGRELVGRLAVGQTYIGRRPLPYSELGHDAYLLDAGAEVRAGPVALTLEAFNLLDAEWYDGEFVYASAFGSTASLVPQRHVTVGPPRSFLLTLALFL